MQSLGMISNSASEAISWGFSEDGRYLAVEFSDMTVIVFDADTKQALVQLTGADLPARDKGFTPGAKGFVHLSIDGALRYWELGDKLPKTAPSVQMTAGGDAKIITSVQHGFPQTRISRPNAH